MRGGRPPIEGARGSNQSQYRQTRWRPSHPRLGPDMSRRTCRNVAWDAWGGSPATSHRLGLGSCAGTADAVAAISAKLSEPSPPSSPGPVGRAARTITVRGQPGGLAQPGERPNTNRVLGEGRRIRCRVDNAWPLACFALSAPHRLAQVHRVGARSKRRHNVVDSAFACVSSSLYLKSIHTHV